MLNEKQISRVVNRLTGIALACSLCFSAAAIGSTKLLTIQGAGPDSGDVIEVPDDIEIGLEVTTQGITITAPELDLRLRCLGEATDSGYCYIAASGLPGSGSDSDNDGVPDSIDLCTNSSSAYTNQDGCPDTDGDGYPNNLDDCPTQGGNVGADGCPVTSSADTDGDGVLDDDDSCPNEGGIVDADGCPSDTDGDGVVDNDDSCPTQSGTQANGCPATNSGEYCANPASTNVSCSASRTLDTWWLADASYIDSSKLAIPEGRILSLPFTTRDSSSDDGFLQLTSNMPTVLSTTVRVWYSSTPGGPKLSDAGCQLYANQAQLNFGWTQVPGAGGRFNCNLGASEQVRYFNIAVKCYPDVGSCTNPDVYYDGTYRFELIAR